MGVEFPFEVIKEFWNEMKVMVTQHYEYMKCF